MSSSVATSHACPSTNMVSPGQRIGRRTQSARTRAGPTLLINIVQPSRSAPQATGVSGVRTQCIDSADQAQAFHPPIWRSCGSAPGRRGSVCHGNRLAACIVSWGTPSSRRNIRMRRMREYWPMGARLAQVRRMRVKWSSYVLRGTARDSRAVRRMEAA